MKIFETLLEAEELINLSTLFESPESKARYLAKQQKAGLIKAISLDNSIKANLVKDKQAPTDEELEAVVLELSKYGEKHMQWLVNMYCKLHNDSLQFRLEDKQRLQNALSGFEENRKHLKQKDLLKYKTLAELENAIFGEGIEEHEDDYEHNALEKELIEKKEVKILIKKPGLRVYIPLTVKASQCFGRNTNWCTAYTSSYNQYESYSKRGPLYIVVLNGKKYQFHFKTEQFMNARDQAISKQALREMFDKKPELYTLLKTELVKHGIIKLLKDEDITDKNALVAFKKNKKNPLWVINNFKPSTLKTLPELHEEFLKALDSSDIPRDIYRNETYASWLNEVLTADDLEQLAESIGEAVNADHKYYGMLQNLADPLLDKWMGKYKQNTVEELLKYISNPNVSVHAAFSAMAHNAIKRLLKYESKFIEMIPQEAILKCARSKYQLETLLDSGLKLTEQLAIKLLEINHELLDTIISKLDDQKLINRLRERARMFAKSKAEASWRR